MLPPRMKKVVMRIVKAARGIEWESKALVQGPAQVCSRLLICMIIDCYSALRTINEDLIKLPTKAHDIQGSQCEHG